MSRIRFGAWVLFTVFLGSALALAAGPRQWQSGKLMDTEQQKVADGSTTNYHTDSETKYKNGKTSHSKETTARTTDNVDTYEVYTIQGPDKTYVAREKLLFPWSKPANVTVGAEIKFAVEGKRLYILGDDEKEHKASVVKISVNQKE